MAARIILLLVLVNCIKIPPENVPVYVFDNLSSLAFATPWFILIREDSNNDTVLSHEHCHIRQMNRYGSLWFLLLNGYELYTNGYHNNIFEKECYAEEYSK